MTCLQSMVRRFKLVSEKVGFLAGGEAACWCWCTAMGSKGTGLRGSWHKLDQCPKNHLLNSTTSITGTGTTAVGSQCLTFGSGAFGTTSIGGPQVKFYNISVAMEF